MKTSWSFTFPCLSLLFRMMTYADLEKVVRVAAVFVEQGDLESFKQILLLGLMTKRQQVRSAFF
jgi:hypothetical protein